MHPILIKALPYIAGGSLLLAVGGTVGGYIIGRGDGRDLERATWQAARAELLRLRTERNQWAAEKLAQQSAAIPQAGVKEIVRVETHWRDRPVRECFDADLVRSLEEARATVRRSATASPSGD
jgi:hypothetical protein